MIATLLFVLLLQGVSAEVVEIVDGDTLKVRLSGEVVSVRLIGVDAPEGASAEHLEFLLGETVRLEPEKTELARDMFGRRISVRLLITLESSSLGTDNAAWLVEEY